MHGTRHMYTFSAWGTRHGLASVLEKMQLVKDNRMIESCRKGKEKTKQNQGKERIGEPVY